MRLTPNSSLVLVTLGNNTLDGHEVTARTESRFRSPRAPSTHVVPPTQPKVG